MQRSYKILCQQRKTTIIMKKNISDALCLLTVIFVSFLQPGCKKDNMKKTYTTTTYTILSPVYKDKSTFLSDINGSASQPIENAGKIYIKDKFIFLNEVDKGIHVINNSDPAHPVQTAFLNITGNQDIAVKGNTLYADMYTDLLAIDIADVLHVRTTKVLYNLFTDRNWINGYPSDSNKVIVDWIKKDTTVTVENNPNPDILNNGYLQMSASSVQSSAAPAKSSAAGVAGSMARMVLMNNYLYAITEPHSLGVINVSNPAAPYEAVNIGAGFDLQTIYPFKDKLFMGSAVGLFMYDVSDPEHPAKLGQFSHGRACDPVVTDGKFAYVTLHAGTACGGSANELNVINIQDLMSPSLVKSYSMTKPTGLSKDNNLLFVCDGTSGVKLYDASNPANLKLLKQIESNEPYDVIAGNNKALVVAKNGIYQYDYSNIDKILQLSFISTKK